MSDCQMQRTITRIEGLRNNVLLRVLDSGLAIQDWGFRIGDSG
jgi:hypothetical protein